MLKHISVGPGKKDKLSEEEMLAKKAEAAQRRRMQVEKATKESEVGEKSFLAFSISIWHVSVSRSQFQLCFDLCRRKL